MARIRLPLWKKVLFAAFLVVFALAITEVVVRVAGLGPEAGAAPGEPPEPDAFGYFVICDQQLGFRNRSNGRYQAHRLREKPWSTTDERGYRNGVGWDVREDSPVVAFVGDSYTFASEVNDDETGPSEVAKLLSDEFDVRVLNAGVRGYSALQVKRTLGECLESFPCVRAAIYTYCGNDLEESLVPCTHHPAKSPVLAFDKVTGEFRDVEVAEPTVAWGESFLDWQPPGPPGRWAKWTSWCRARSALCHHSLAGLERLSGAVTTARPRFEEDPADLPADKSRWHQWALEHGGEKIMIRLLAEMKRMCEQHETEFVATSAYTGLDHHTPAEFARWCQAAGVRYVSLVDHFRERPAAYTAVRADGRHDSHYGPHGTRTYAAVLAPVVREILRSDSRRDYSAIR